MGGVLSKPSRINQICTFQEKNFIDRDGDYDIDSFQEPDKWLSEVYHYDKILTIENDSS